MSSDSDSDYFSENRISNLTKKNQGLRQKLASGYSSSDSELIPIDDIIKSIKNSQYVILYSSWCGYSRKALELLNQNKIKAKKYEIEDIQGTMNDIRSKLSKEKSLGFPSSYSSRPMIFMNGKFIGGYDQLSKKYK
jgi:glutaredoxin